MSIIETDEHFLEQLKRHEGLRLTPYRCTAGALTIGYGHNLDANPIIDITPHTKITEGRATRILIEDCRKYAVQLDGRMTWWRTLNEPRQAVILNMAFNLGILGLLSFKNTLRAVKEERWSDAADGMLASKWAGQVKRRAVELAAQMRSGEWAENE